MSDYTDYPDLEEKRGFRCYEDVLVNPYVVTAWVLCLCVAGIASVFVMVYFDDKDDGLW